MNKKLIVGLIIFLVIVLISIAGVFAFTKIINSPKKIFAKNLKTAFTEISDFEPKPLKDIYDAYQNDIVETDIETDIEYSDEESSVGSANFFNSTITLEMDDVRFQENDSGEEENRDNNEDNNRDDEERNNENEDNNRDEVENRSNEERQDEQENNNNENEDQREAEDFLDSYTWNENGYVSSNNDAEKYNLKLNLNSTIDYKNKNENISLDAKINDNTFIIGNFNYKKNIIGLFVEGLNEKYIALENKNLRKVAKNYGIDDDVLEYIPDSLEIMDSDLEEYKNFTDKTIQYINSTLNEFDDKQYSVNDFSDSLGVYFTDNYEGKVSTLKAPLKTLKKKFYEYGKDVLNDSDVLISVKESVSKETLEEAIKKLEDKIKDIESMDDSEIGEISIYVTNNNIVKVSFNTESKDVDNFYLIIDKSGNKFELCLDNKTSYDTTSKEIVSPACSYNVYFELDDSNMIVKSVDTYAENDLNAMLEENNAKVEESRDDEDNEDDGFGFVSFSNTKKELKDYKERYPKSESTTTISYKPNDSGLYSGSIKIDCKENGKKTNTFDSIKSIKYDIKKSDGKSIIDVNSDNGIIINDFQEEDFQSLIVESLANMDKYAQENEMSWARIVRNIMSMFSNVEESNEESSSEVDNEEDLFVNRDDGENRTGEDEEEYRNDEENEEENRDEE